MMGICSFIEKTGLADLRNSDPEGPSTLSDNSTNIPSVADGNATANRSSVLLFDVSDRTQFELTGSDRARFLHAFTTNDVKRLAPGQGCEAFITNIKGKVVGHLFVFCDPNSLWLDGTARQEAAISSHLGKFLLVDDVQLIPRSADRGEFYISGNRAAAVLGLNEELPIGSHLHRTITEIPVDIRRVDLLAEPGFLISVPRVQLDSVSASLVASGGVKGSSELFEALRIEAGFPVYGVDITEDNLAQEVARTRQCISFNKGCYLGQEPIARIDSMGHTNQELRRLRFETQIVPHAGTAVFEQSGTNQIGLITSASLSMASTNDSSQILNAIALMKRVAFAAGTQVRFMQDQIPVIGTVV